jgi:uncharacterized protein (DUF433 family)
VHRIATVTTWRDHIALDPAILVGKPVIKGTRLAVEQVLEHLAAGWTVEEIVDSYPGVSPEAVRACLAYAKEAVGHERAFPAA